MLTDMITFGTASLARGCGFLPDRGSDEMYYGADGRAAAWGDWEPGTGACPCISASELARRIRDSWRIHVVPYPAGIAGETDAYGCRVYLPDDRGCAFTTHPDVSSVTVSRAGDDFNPVIGTYEDALALGLDLALNMLANIIRAAKEGREVPCFFRKKLLH